MPLQQFSHHENMTICATYLSITALKVQWPLRFAFSYVQPVTQRYKRRTVIESSLQSVQSPHKIWTIPVYKCTVGKPCTVLPRINTLDCQQKKMGHKRNKGKSMIHALYVLWYAKRHDLGQSDIEQRTKSSPYP